MNATQVAERFNVHRITISRLNSRFRDTGHVKDRARSGRPRITTPGQDRYIRNVALRRRFVTARSIQLSLEKAENVENHGGNRRVSDQTIRNRLHASGLRAHNPADCPRLTNSHRRARLCWAQRHRHWTRQQWGRVLFTDESRFCLRSIDGRLKVWRRRGERFASCCLQRKVAFSGGSVMIWGGIRNRRKTTAVIISGTLNSRRYISEILEPHVVPLAHEAGTESDQFIFQDDNARPHRATIVMDFLQTEGIQRMEWPAYSPDLNPIEGLWDQLGRAVTSRTNVSTSLEDLKDILLQEWNAIDQGQITRLINSMRRRCLACINALGDYTGY